MGERHPSCPSVHPSINRILQPYVGRKEQKCREYHKGQIPCIMGKGAGTEDMKLSRYERETVIGGAERGGTGTP